MDRAKNTDSLIFLYTNKMPPTLKEVSMCDVEKLLQVLLSHLMKKKYQRISRLTRQWFIIPGQDCPNVNLIKALSGKSYCHHLKAGNNSTPMCKQFVLVNCSNLIETLNFLLSRHNLHFKQEITVQECLVEYVILKHMQETGQNQRASLDLPSAECRAYTEESTKQKNIGRTRTLMRAYRDIILLWRIKTGTFWSVGKDPTHYSTCPFIKITTYLIINHRD